MPAPTRLSLELRDALNARGLRYCHWKSNHHLAEALAGEADLDVLVAEPDLATFREAVAALGGLRIISQPWASYPGVEDWLMMDEETGALLHLHTHATLVTGLKRVKHLYLPWSETVLGDLRLDPHSKWPIPSAEMELLILLVRIWAKMPPLRRLFAPRIPRHIVEELRWLEASADPGKAVALAERLKLPISAMPALKDNAEIIATSRKLYGAVKQHYRMSWPGALLSGLVLNGKLALTRFRYRKFGLVRYRKTLDQKGAMIALIGSDGSGKSTLSAGLMKWLTYKLDTHSLYMGSGDGNAGLLNALRRSLSTSWKKAKQKPAQLPSGTPSGTSEILDSAPRKPATFSSKLWRLFNLQLLRRKVRKLRKARRLADQGSIILIDRYPQSQFKGISDGPRQQDGQGFGWAARLERELFAEAAHLGPDMVLKLVIDPKIAQARKPDHDLPIITRKAAIVAALTFPNSITETLDAAEPAEAVLLTAKQRIWHFIQKQGKP